MVAPATVKAIAAAAYASTTKKIDQEHHLPAESATSGLNNRYRDDANHQQSRALLSNYGMVTRAAAASSSSKGFRWDECENENENELDSD